jgi:hypothetical protein
VEGIRIAMWSGPRNISTALMRAWENRSDCQVWDEPLYPWWLWRTGAAHPGRATVLRAHADDLDLQQLVPKLSKCVSPIMYHKHMAHHLLPEVPRCWMEGARHAFLIRDPARVLASLAAKYPEAGIDDTGLPQQVELLRWLHEHGHPTPPVVDSDDVLASPRPMLKSLCAALGVPFEEAMLSWPAGPRLSDGAWAKWWYERVHKTTGFGPSSSGEPEVPSLQLEYLPACQELYDELASLRLRP